MHVNCTVVMFEMGRCTLGVGGADDVVWSIVVSLRWQKGYREVLLYLFRWNHKARRVHFYASLYAHAVCICSRCGFALVCACVCCVWLCMHIAMVVHYNRTLHFVVFQFPSLGHCSLHWPWMGIIKGRALPSMHNFKLFYTAPNHYNARQSSTHLIFTAIISSMVIIEDSIITNHHCPYAPSHATEEQQTEGDMGWKEWSEVAKKLCNWHFNSSNFNLYDTCNQTITEFYQEWHNSRLEKVWNSYSCTELKAAVALCHVYEHWHAYTMYTPSLTYEGSAIPVCVCGPWVY